MFQLAMHDISIFIAEKMKWNDSFIISNTKWIHKFDHCTWFKKIQNNVKEQHPISIY
jgi:hypothetical protein